MSPFIRFTIGGDFYVSIIGITINQIEIKKLAAGAKTYIPKGKQGPI